MLQLLLATRVASALHHTGSAGAQLVVTSNSPQRTRHKRKLTCSECMCCSANGEAAVATLTSFAGLPVEAAGAKVDLTKCDGSGDAADKACNHGRKYC